MDSEAKIILAFLFNRSGKTGLTEAELYLPLSMELGWFSTKEAQQFVKYTLKQGLVMKKDGVVSPTFSVDAVKIPVGFAPSKKSFSEPTDEKKGKDIVEEIILRIYEHVHQDKNEILAEIKREVAEKNLLMEVAALYVGRKHGVDVSEWYPVVESVLATESKG
jgi:hypothetical protein